MRATMSSQEDGRARKALRLCGAEVRAMLYAAVRLLIVLNAAPKEPCPT